ncbi:hypothetical protein C817_03112 [Dorea sp. 5-2]|nr:hypothetical protein C817_03112 [Dorea sp. 5-2]
MLHKEKRIVHFIDGVYHNNYLWFSALEWNGFYRINMKSNDTEFLGIFDHADVFASKIYYQTLLYHKYIFFIPWFSDYLARLDTETMKMKYWKLPQNILELEAKFRAAYLQGTEIIMFPMFGNIVSVFDIEKEEYVNKKIEICRDQKFGKTNGDFMQGCRIKSKVYLPSMFRNCILEYDLRIHTYRWIKLLENRETVVGITKYSETELLFLSWKGDIWKYDLYGDDKKLIYTYTGEKDCPYAYIILHEDSLYLIPAFEENVVMLKKDKINLVVYPDDWKLQTVDPSMGWFFSGYHKSEEEFLLYPCKGNMLLKMKTKQSDLEGVICNDDIQREIVLLEKENFERVHRDRYEESKISIKMLTKLLKNLNIENKDRLNEGIGMKIWKKGQEQ